jgi:NADH pyrophosphatase NudC (nudix superfamily)
MGAIHRHISKSANQQIMRYCPQCGKELTEAERNGMMRKVCADESCGFIHWDNPVPVVAAIVEQEGHVILVRSIGWPEHFFGLVTGFLEKNEEVEAAVLREVKEETGLEVKMGSYIGTYSFFRRNQLIMAYHVIAEPGEIILDESELNGYRRVPIEKVRAWPAGTGHALADWLRSKGYEPEYLDFNSK